MGRGRHVTGGESEGVRDIVCHRPPAFVFGAGSQFSVCRAGRSWVVREVADGWGRGWRVTSAVV
jgi:hypothetical protein